MTINNLSSSSPVPPNKPTATTNQPSQLGKLGNHTVTPTVTTPGLECETRIRTIASTQLQKVTNRGVSATRDYRVEVEGLYKELELATRILDNIQTRSVKDPDTKARNINILKEKIQEIEQHIGTKLQQPMSTNLEVLHKELGTAIKTLELLQQRTIPHEQKIIASLNKWIERLQTHIKKGPQ